MKTLLEDTYTLLRETHMPRREIAERAGVGLEWLHKFAQGRIPDPGVTRVQRVYDFLSRRRRAA